MRCVIQKILTKNTRIPYENTQTYLVQIQKTIFK